jgi:hypothetical protein
MEKKIQVALKILPDYDFTFKFQSGAVAVPVLGLSNIIRNHFSYRKPTRA